MDRKQIEKQQKIRTKGAKILAIVMIVAMVLFTIVGSLMFLVD